MSSGDPIFPPVMVTLSQNTEKFQTPGATVQALRDGVQIQALRAEVARLTTVLQAIAASGMAFSAEMAKDALSRGGCQ